MESEYILKWMQERKSVRSFTEQEVDTNLVANIIDHVRLAPSGFNAQPWRFVIVKDKTMIQKLYQYSAYQKQLDTASCVIVLYSNLMDVREKADDVLHPEMNLEKKKSDKEALLETLDMAPEVLQSQGYIALGYLLLALTAYGISSVPMLGFDLEKVKALLEIEGNILSVVAAGYGADEGHSHHRLTLGKIVRIY
ncbi:MULTISPECIES: nitroreductase family protein [Oceanobacillus]|uniref:Nitroreductase family protein n=1 Tax=Oceanobacillus aidingensis TaxID=645964 RepID=A0ABV9K0K2_9BACI|nr:nitroreductase family protein [Oceanobacillus oncorhynchi]MDM8101868.1 nitroreductase family protein [Oceanobacillus oncorhynchi]UUI42104.1 nitroreductase family protein [Oceanobacillus oncorhynchi]